MKGLQRLIKNDFKFSENEVTDKELKEYKIQSNNVLQFIREDCVIKSDTYYSSSQLYKAYNQFCEREGLKYVANPKFKQELLKIEGIKYNSSYRSYDNVTKKLEGKMRAYTGITLISNYKEKQTVNCKINIL